MKIYFRAQPTDGGEFLRRALAAEGAAFESLLVTEAGKPYLEKGPKFNLTHTAGLTAAAFSRQEVGLDAERRRARKLSALMERLTPEEREEDFFELWTAKEAYVKFRGGTLAAMLKDLVYVRGTLLEGGAPLPLFLRHFELEGCVLCVCAKEAEPLSFVRI